MLQSTFPKSNVHHTKDHGHCFVVCCWSDPLPLFRSQQHRYIWEVCSANPWDGLKIAVSAASIGQQKGPHSFPLRQCQTTHGTTNASNIEQIGLWNFASFAILTWALINQPPFPQASRKLFIGKTLPQPAGSRKCFPRVQWILKQGFFFATGIIKHFSWAKLWWLKWFPFWLIKMYLIK